MLQMHEEARVTSKGQITLPKSVRQALGVAVGGKVAFDLRGGEVVVTRADNGEHEDPAIGAFLGLLEQDVRAGKNIGALPDKLAKVLLAHSTQAVNPDDDIEGDVTL